MIPTREQAWDLLCEYNEGEFHRLHARIVGDVMRYFAAQLGYADEADFWQTVGILHDLDFEQYPDQHCMKEAQILRERGVDERLVHAVVSHGYLLTVDVQPEHQMEKVLYATDELTGLIGAVVRMLPTKSVQDLQLKSLKKKFKDKKFAAGCSREVIERGADMLGWSLDGETTLIDRETLCKSFTLDRITKKDAVFDETKLEWMNGQYIKEMSAGDWIDASVPWLARARAGVAADAEISEEEIRETAADIANRPEFYEKLYPLVAERETRLVDAADKLAYMFWGPRVEVLDEKSVKKVLLKEGARADEALAACRAILADESRAWEAGTLEAACRELGEEDALNMKLKLVLQPLRVAVCGNMVSPPLFESIELLPREDVIARIDQVTAEVFGGNE